MPSPAKKRKTESGSVIVNGDTDASIDGIAEHMPSLDDTDSHNEGLLREDHSLASSENERAQYQSTALMIEPRLNRRRKKGIPQLSKHDMKWNEMFNRLVQYKQAHRNTLVPQNYEHDSRLGRWVHYQRVEYWMFKQEGSGKITQARIDKLDSIGFEWDPQKTKWNSMFRRLVDYKAENGHCMVPKGHKQDPELANWVRNQRLEHSNLKKNKKSRMTDERMEALNGIGFQWKASRS